MTTDQRLAIFERRFAAVGEFAVNALDQLYGELPDYPRWQKAILDAVEDSLNSRPDDLCSLDEEREKRQPDWHQSHEMIGYMCYADRFAGTLEGVAGRVDYLKSLGVRYLHLLSVLRKRQGGSDGGFAIADYFQTNPEVGTMDNLERLAKTLRANRISLCLDFVYNHVSDQHGWVKKAVAGDPYYRDFFFTFPDRQMPDRFEESLGEVFPSTQPGNFTYSKDGGFWVWTTFYPFQWDLNYRNPAVFLEMLKAMLFLANKGVEIFRMDAAAFAWKALGTDCLNLPQTHMLLQAFRWLLAIAAPATVLKAEAIVGARDVAKYFGLRENRGKECQLAYHNPLMAAMWNSLATGDVSKMADMLEAISDKPSGTSWVTYVRCHDDIGWSTLQDSADAGWGATKEELHFLSDFYAGEISGSFAKGRKFQVTDDEGFHGTNGTLASLAGLESASRDQQALAISRIQLLNATTFAFNGIPLIFMGEEIGLLNDYAYASDNPSKDGRWLHRPAMPWRDMAALQDVSTPQGTILANLTSLSAARKQLPVLHTENPLRIVDTGNRHLFGFLRSAPDSQFMFLGNYSDQNQKLDAELLVRFFGDMEVVDFLTGKPVNFANNLLRPYKFFWLVTKVEESKASG